MQKGLTMIATVQRRPVSCSSLETGSLIFAIFNIVIVVLLSIANLVGLTYYSKIVVWLIINNPDFELHYMKETENLFYTMTFWIMSTVFLVSLVLAGFLLNGIIKRNHEHVKAYFVYGVVTDVLSVLATIAFLLIAIGDVNAMGLAIGCLIICCAYTGILVMIYRTYRKFKKINSQHDQPKTNVKVPFSCMSVQTGTLIFAILNIVVAVLTSIVSLVSLFFWGISMLTMLIDPAAVDYILYKVSGSKIVYLTLGSLILTTATLVSLLFAAFLVNGIIKRKSGHLKVYFVYGVIVDLLSVLATIGYLQSLDVVFASLVICSIYTGILVMIRKTYRKIENTYSQYDHQKLVEELEKY